MPIYEYRCEDCGNELEKLQRISEDPLKECPSCGKSTLRRLISAAGFRLKGSGWYETDFKQGNRRNVVESGGEKPAADSSESGSTGESRPAEKKPADSGSAESKTSSEQKSKVPSATPAGQPA